ncbi:DUF423 domain-containing protein [Salinisphaera sp. USBA-960]|uniref:DUF423 domain-containing protein n=1 Tax=Salinisphaera orenii TaxID=856731 RepID=UPI000DBE7547|nr:DUF423 domain-containing protein [Salifodinibacter halophilus]NNC27045.1 DUF423 domain-containing protein [Salifodinibacter halophilus]
MAQAALIIGGLYGLLAVVLGAFGAHALGDTLTTRMQSIWHTAEQYQFYHALALLLLGVLARLGMAGGLTNAAVVCFALGTLVFSGSLYVLAITNVSQLGAVTPIGGVLLIIGWALFIAAVLMRA